MPSLDEAIQAIVRRRTDLTPLRIEVIGVSQDVIDNILPVLYPSIHFVSTISHAEDCPGLVASLQLDPQQPSHCNVEWTIQSSSTDKGSHSRLVHQQWDHPSTVPLIQQTQKLLSTYSTLF